MPTFDDYEQSTDSGEPVELHEFVERETGRAWRYVDGPVAISYGGNTYIPVWIEGAEIEQGANPLRDQTSVRVDWDCELVRPFKRSIPELPIDYTRYKLHVDQAAEQFSGTVTAVRFRQEDRQGKRHAEILIDPATNDLKDVGLATRSGRQCQVRLFSNECGLDRADWAYSGALATVTGKTITSTVFSGLASGWLAGGDFVAANDAWGIARRKILSHVGATVILSRAVYGMSAGQLFTCYAGCDHTRDCCGGKFGNLPNMRGQPLIPDEDPWGEAII